MTASSSSSSSFGTTTTDYKSIKTSTPSVPSKSTNTNSTTIIITRIKKTQPILLLILALAVSVIGLVVVSHAHRSFPSSSSLSPIISSQSLMTSSIDDVKDQDFFAEDPVASFPDVAVTAPSFPVTSSSSSLSVIASQSLMMKTNNDDEVEVVESPGNLRVGGARHCCYSAAKNRPGAHGTDGVNCEVYAINGWKNGCRARSGYAASHPHDPCVFSPGIDCCPKSNLDHSIAYAFGGCHTGH